MEPHARAFSRVAVVWLKPRTSATPARSRAARPSEPPMSPTPMTAMVWGAPVLTASHDGLAGPARQVEHAAGVLAEGRGGQRLRAVAESVLGVGMHLDDQAVRAGGDAGQRQRRTSSRRPVAWLGSTITGRWLSA